MNSATVLVWHVAYLVSVDGAQVVDGNLDGLLGDSVAAEVRLDGELVAGATRRTCALAWTRTEL